jgi:hypothetical protein
MQFGVAASDSLRGNGTFGASEGAWRPPQRPPGP